MVVSYAQLKDDISLWCKEICKFLGLSLNETQLQAVVERSSFQYMKANSSQFEPPVPVLRGEHSATMFRKGEIGGHEQLLSPERRAELDALHQRELAALGSDFPYEDFFLDAK